MIAQWQFSRTGITLIIALAAALLCLHCGQPGHKAETPRSAETKTAVAPSGVDTLPTASEEDPALIYFRASRPDAEGAYFESTFCIQSDGKKLEVLCQGGDGRYFQSPDGRWVAGGNFFYDKSSGQKHSITIPSSMFKGWLNDTTFLISAFTDVERLFRYNALNHDTATVLTTDGFRKLGATVYYPSKNLLLSAQGSGIAKYYLGNGRIENIKLETWNTGHLSLTQNEDLLSYYKIDSRPSTPDSFVVCDSINGKTLLVIDSVQGFEHARYRISLGPEGRWVYFSERRFINDREYFYIIRRRFPDLADEQRIFACSVEYMRIKNITAAPLIPIK